MSIFIVSFTSGAIRSDIEMEKINKEVLASGDFNHSASGHFDQLSSFYFDQ